MDAAWSSKGNYEDFLLKKEHQQPPTFNQHGGTTVDQLDLSCMINGEILQMGQKQKT